MRDLKTYLSVAPVASTLWLAVLAGLLVEINRLFLDALGLEGVTKIRDQIKHL